MRLIFCGTPEYAVPSLRALLALAPRHDLVAVVSQPDRPKGRSGVATPPPVVAAARSAGVPQDRILQPPSINQTSTLEHLSALAPDLLCVIAYGNVLRKKALALPRIAALNAHASLLPRYRGAAPIQVALLAGDAETGVSIMKMDAGLDTGPVLFARRTPILPEDTAGSLHDRLAELSAECFVEALERLERGERNFQPQDERQASYASKLDKDAGRVNWASDAAYLERFVRAMNPWPGAWTVVRPTTGGKPVRVRLCRAQLSTAAAALPIGQGVVANGGRAIDIGCRSGVLSVTVLQPEGRRELPVAEFLNGAGRALQTGSQWGQE